MSDTERRPYAQVLYVATAIANALAPACHRIEIAGSVRREKAMCGDVELVAIPRLHTNLIGDPMDSSEVDDALGRWPITLHKNGNKYKQFSLEWQPGVWFKVDLFLQPDPATWGVNFLLRTGSATFSHFMVTPTWQGGHKPEGFEMKDARVWRNGVALDTPEEIDVFNAFGLAYVEPKDRA